MKLFYELFGDGIPVVLTQGLGVDSRDWQDYVVPLSKKHRVLVWDHRGHGKSGKSGMQEDYEQDYGVSDLESMVYEAGGSANFPAILIGHSMGGYFSLRLAIKNPGLVRGLVLIATGPGFKNPEKREKWNRFILSQKLENDTAENAGRLAVQKDSLVIDNASKINVPALIIVGSKDKAFFHASEFFEKNMKQSNSIVINSAGHNVHKTHSEAVINEILFFVEKKFQESSLAELPG